MARVRDANLMTAAYIPTVGECAAQALANFVALRINSTLHGKPTPDALRASVELTKATLALLTKLPEGSRAQFVAVLPFSRLELDLFRSGRVDDECVSSALAARLVEWANRSPILVDETNVHAADFLADLYPLLDGWVDRERADEVRSRLLEV